MLPQLSQLKRFEQGYLSFEPEIRVRLVYEPDAGEPIEALMTFKGEGTITRSEIEFNIPIEKGQELLPLSQGTIIKKRRGRWIDERGLTWEIDEYEGAHSGLWIAETELVSEDQLVIQPTFAAIEVTEDARFKNKSLAKNQHLSGLLELINEQLH